MATVHINDRIRHAVYNRITNFYSPRLQAVQNEIQDTFLGDSIYYAAFPNKTLSALKDLETTDKRQWANRTSTGTVVFEYLDSNNTLTRSAETIRFSSQVPVPVDQRYLHISAENAPEAYAKLVDIKHRFSRLTDERAELLNQIKTILRENKTIRAVLKVWPDALEWMPNDVVERHNAPMEKRNVTEREVKELSENAQVTLVKLKLVQ